MKNGLKMLKLRKFFIQNWKAIANFQNSLKSLLNFNTLHGVVIWCKSRLIWTQIEGADMFGAKYLKTSILSVLL